MELHKGLCTAKLGDSLPYQNLSLFLDLAHDRTARGCDSTMLEQIIRQILADIKIMNRNQVTCPNPMASNTAAESQGNITGCVIAVRQELHSIKNFLEAQETSLREEHGGVLLYPSISELMVNISGCGDLTTMAVYEEQVLAMHVEQLVAGNARGASYIGDVIGYMDKVLSQANGN